MRLASFRKKFDGLKSPALVVLGLIPKRFLSITDEVNLGNFLGGFTGCPLYSSRQRTLSLLAARCRFHPGRGAEYIEDWYSRKGLVDKS